MDPDYDETVPFADFSSDEEDDPNVPNMKGVLMSASGVPLNKHRGEDTRKQIEELDKKLYKVETRYR